MIIHPGYRDISLSSRIKERVRRSIDVIICSQVGEYRANKRLIIVFVTSSIHARDIGRFCFARGSPLSPRLAQAWLLIQPRPPRLPVQRPRPLRTSQGALNHARAMTTGYASFPSDFGERITLCHVPDFEQIRESGATALQWHNRGAQNTSGHHSQYVMS